jgi:hypothetical protein
MYKLSSPFKENPTNCVIRLSDNACIVMHPDNTDYQSYLKWLEEGGVPIPADEVTQ